MFLDITFHLKFSGGYMKSIGNSIDSKKMKRAKFLYRRRKAGLGVPASRWASFS